MLARNSILGLLLIAAITQIGCHRKNYRLGADVSVNYLLHEKSDYAPWTLPDNYSIYPASGSRLAVPGCPDDPCLPDPAPKLYQFEIVGSSLAPDDAGDDESINTFPDAGTTADDDLVISAIPPAAWQDIPADCRKRMFDFASLRQEARLTREEFEIDVEIAADDNAARLKLQDIIDLALANSRDYQSRKEALYRVALILSLERFDYMFWPTTNGLTSSLNYSHDRTAGITENTLGIPTSATAGKLLCTGGDFLARFANQVLLTFNGDNGFAADVSSDLFFEITQPFFQRDIVFENLTQAERNLVYAVRDFARFRKEFFVDFASEYYSLIRSFRQVEIDSQNYFSLVRAFNQAEAEYRAGLVPRFQVDQVEQNLLSGRGGLIATCNDLEQSLDSLKINMGLPTETPLNIDLTELNQLTQSDQLSVSGDLIDRVRRRLLSALREPERIELLSGGVVLVDRILDANRILLALDLPEQDVQPFRQLRVELLVDSAKLTASQIRSDLENEINSESPSAPVIFQRTLALINELLILADSQLQLAELMEKDSAQIEGFASAASDFLEQAGELSDELSRIIRERQLLLLPELVQDAADLRRAVEDLVSQIDELNGVSAERFTPQEELDLTIARINQLLEEAQAIQAATGTGLTPVEINLDEAMLTALVLRYDLMNQRGALADNWRAIKLAADDLKSILNLRASQLIQTRADVNRVFDFTFDESRTDISLQFDAPVNRILQRNAYRNALINYQASLRDLTLLEDTIKFSIRNELRNLALDREQYEIAVASAALAFERVVSTSLEFRLGTGGVSARDFLEAQTAYTDALSAVASRHIEYIVDRTQLFLDLELLEVGSDGFWAPLYDESFQPSPYLEMPPWAFPVYGELPCVWYSKCMKRMLNVPVGPPVILAEQSPTGEDTTVVEDPEPIQPLELQTQDDAGRQQ